MTTTFEAKEGDVGGVDTRSRQSTYSMHNVQDAILRQGFKQFEFGCGTLGAEGNWLVFRRPSIQRELRMVGEITVVVLPPSWLFFGVFPDLDFYVGNPGKK